MTTANSDEKKNPISCGNDGNPPPAPSEQTSPTSPISGSRRHLIAFAPSSAMDHGDGHQDLFSRPRIPPTTGGQELMGPILRRKKVVSMPLGAGGDFFFRMDHPQTSRQLMLDGILEHPEGAAVAAARQQHPDRRTRQWSLGHTARISNPFSMPSSPPTALTPPESPKQLQLPRSRQSSRQGSRGGVMSGVLRRKQVSLDLLGPNDFFATAPEDFETFELLPVIEGAAQAGIGEEEEEEEETLDVPHLIRPLRFAPRLIPKPRIAGGGHGGGGLGPSLAPVSETADPTATPSLDAETMETFEKYARANAGLRLQLSSFSNLLRDEGMETKAISDFMQRLQDSNQAIEEHEKSLQQSICTAPSSTGKAAKLSPSLPPSSENVVMQGEVETKKLDEGEVEDQQDESYVVEDDGIIRATRSDLIKTGFLFAIMLALTAVVCAWRTHVDEESFIQGPVGLACVTNCSGNLTTRDFFHGHSHFDDGKVIQLTLHLDPSEIAYERQIHLDVQVVGVETGFIKATHRFSPPDSEERRHEEASISVDFEHPHEPHVINVYSEDENLSLSFTLSAHVLSHISDYSEIVAALIMVAVYFFILTEVIHRTLVAIFGSMFALMFFFIMHEGSTESIRQIMLHLEWSTLGLLFGMMLLVGELSHTGIFEWCAVRLLVASKGSFVRLMVLLCTLTAIASAFLDNVTTMLLVAPVTIDMCNILGVDPRPYLIGEVILSNVGGTATLIGDPPNIIIGSSFDDVGFVDFIIHVLPCIFFFCVPVSLAFLCYIYRYYLTTTKMRVLDTDKLRETYPIYDQPRLMIAGTTTSFVILMFFLHPVHHKDTAWIALLGAFITITFTNPHDVQEALRSHVEWDTLLFFAGLFVLVEVCAAMGLLRLIGNGLATYIESQDSNSQLSVAITLLLWVSAITSAFLDNIPYTATMIPIVKILSEELPDTLPIKTLAWALSFGACLGGNGTLLGASSNIVTAGIATNKGFEISFLNFLYPGMIIMFITVAISNIYMLLRYVWSQ